MNSLASPFTTIRSSPITTGVAAYLTLLHESPDQNSATRHFRGRPVLTRTLARLADFAGRASAIDERSTLPMVISCWDDQLQAARAAAGGMARLFSIGPRRSIQSLDTLTAATRWLDGWRHGPLLTTVFDRGFHAPTALQALNEANAFAAADGNRSDLHALGEQPPGCSAIHSLLLVDPASALLSPELLASLLTHANQLGDAHDVIFHPTAPGLSGAVLRKPFLDRLARATPQQVFPIPIHPGKFLHYFPDNYGRDPLSESPCAPHPTPAARTLHSFLLHTPSQIRRAESCSAGLKDGDAASYSVDDLLAAYAARSALYALPKDLRLELTTRRNTNPVFRPKPALREEVPVSAYLPLLDELAGPDCDTRITLGGTGAGTDPLLYPDILALVAEISARRIPLAIESDLVQIPSEVLRGLATAGGLDLLLFHIPATTPETYARLMGVDAIDNLIQNLNCYLAARGSGGAGIPVPVFTKTRQNLAEMEPWYDHWLRTLGTAVIDGAHSHAGSVDDLSATNLAPPHRVPCRRLSHRMTLLSNGHLATCEYDQRGSGRIESVGQAWQSLSPLRAQHNSKSLPQLPALCGACTEWHRP